MNVLGELHQSRQQIERQNEELTRLATRDPLTGCYNRRAFFDQAEPLFAQAKAKQQPLACIMGDIDHFKQFNDKYGHTVGDKVIQAVAKSFVGGLREVDVLCRYGGEEFCIFLPGATSHQAAVVAERLRNAVESHAGPSIRTTSGLKVTSSFGVATLTDGASDSAGLIDQADEALYVSIQNGRNRVSQWKRPVAPQVIPLRSPQPHATPQAALLAGNMTSSVAASSAIALSPAACTAYPSSPNQERISASMATSRCLETGPVS